MAHINLVWKGKMWEMKRRRRTCRTKAKHGKVGMSSPRFYAPQQFYGTPSLARADIHICLLSMNAKMGTPAYEHMRKQIPALEGVHLYSWEGSWLIKTEQIGPQITGYSVSRLIHYIHAYIIKIRGGKKSVRHRNCLQNCTDHVLMSNKKINNISLFVWQTQEKHPEFLF